MHNSGGDDIELGSIGFPTEINGIFTRHDASDMLSLCSLAARILVWMQDILGYHQLVAMAQL